MTPISGMDSNWNIADFLRFFRSGQGGYGRLVHKNALNPITYLNVISPPAWVTAIALAVWGGQDLRPLVWILTIVGALPVLISCGAAVYFAGWKTDALRSDNFLLQSTRLMIERQGAQPTVVDVDATEVIENPAAKALPGARPEGMQNPATEAAQEGGKG